MREVYLGSRYHSCVNHVDVKTPDKILARGLPVLSREKSTPSMMKHLELRSSENCLASGRAFRTRMVVWNLLLMPKTVFMIYHAWFLTFIGSALSSLLSLISSWEAVYFHLLHIHWCLYYLDETFIWAYTANTIDWMGPYFWWYFEFLSSVFPLVLFFVQFLLAMIYDPIASPQHLLSYFCFSLLKCYRANCKT